jgi:glutaredoxin
MEFNEPLDKNFTIYSKSGCINCTQLKKILKEKFFVFEEINCDEFLIENKSEFLSFIENKIGKKHNTFPMVFYNGNFIGGYLDTFTFIDKLLAFDENASFVYY